MTKMFRPGVKTALEYQEYGKIKLSCEFVRLAEEMKSLPRIVKPSVHFYAMLLLLWSLWLKLEYGHLKRSS